MHIKMLIDSIMQQTTVLIGRPGFKYLYQNPQTDRFALTLESGDVVITQAYTYCEGHDDCELISTSCRGCCQRGAINHAHVETFAEHRAPTCAGYQGSICNCENEDLVARCVERHCQAFAE